MKHKTDDDAEQLLFIKRYAYALIVTAFAIVAAMTIVVIENL